VSRKWLADRPTPRRRVLEHDEPSNDYRDHDRHAAGHMAMIARLPAQDLMSWTSVVINGKSRWGLRTPPSHSREGAAMVMAIQTRRPTSATHSSSAWMCCSSTCRCWPARVTQAATVRSSRPKAATMAWIGQPWHTRVRTTLTTSAGVRKR
jgi:hypothetical protein